MNLEILHPKVQQFITENLKSDSTKLILKGSPFKDISIQELANQIIVKQKSKQKLPSWFSTTNIYYPEKINLEQSSSEITANHKAKIVSGTSIIDITGGFGVDCYAFSKKFNEVIHCEMNTKLSTIVKHNFQQLNCKNSKTFSGDGIEYLKKSDKNFDCIYIDPSRRNDAKGKVFLLKDCLPNVPKNIDFLFTKTNNILIKNSPMLDISTAINELKYIREIHIVAVKNEVKEMLFLLEKNHNENVEMKTINIEKNNHQVFNFTFQENINSNYSETLTYLYEPNAAILKSGGFHQVSNQLNLYKIHQHSHLYTSQTLIPFPGRVFKVQNIISYNKKKLNKSLLEKKANITTRNFPKSVAQIRKETGIKDGGNTYLFFTTDAKNSLIIIICNKIISN